MGEVFALTAPANQQVKSAQEKRQGSSTTLQDWPEAPAANPPVLVQNVSSDPRHNILDAAASCFMENGFAATSIDDVARGIAVRVAGPNFPAGTGNRARSRRGAHAHR